MPHTRHHIATPRIVQPGSHNVLWLWALFAVLAAALSWKAFDYGRQRAGFDAAASERELSHLQQRIVSLEQERDELRLSAARFERSSQIDQTAVDTVQAELKSLQDERAALRQEVEFLKSLVSGDVTMLQLTELVLDKQEQGNAYTLSFSVSKRAEGNKRVRGTVELVLVGQLKGAPAELSAADLGVDPKLLAMGFVHFQNYEIPLTLPVGFIPRELIVKVKPKGSKFKPFEQTQAWDVEQAE